eukprot:13295605-Alexandrium_andersonii.AAC.1
MSFCAWLVRAVGCWGGAAQTTSSYAGGGQTRFGPALGCFTRAARGFGAAATVGTWRVPGGAGGRILPVRTALVFRLSAGAFPRGCAHNVCKAGALPGILWICAFR